MQNFPVDQIIQNSSCIGVTIQNSEGLAIAFGDCVSSSKVETSIQSC